MYTFSYDVRDRLTSASDPYGRTITYGYDLRGNRTELSTGRQQIQYQYDALSRLRQARTAKPAARSA